MIVCQAWVPTSLNYGSLTLFIGRLFLKVRRPRGSVEHLCCWGDIVYQAGSFLLQEPLSLQRRGWTSRIFASCPFEPAASYRRPRTDEGKLQCFSKDALRHDQRHAVAPYLIVNERLYSVHWRENDAPSRWKRRRHGHGRVRGKYLNRMDGQTSGLLSFKERFKSLTIWKTNGRFGWNLKCHFISNKFKNVSYSPKWKIRSNVKTWMKMKRLMSRGLTSTAQWTLRSSARSLRTMRMRIRTRLLKLDKPTSSVKELLSMTSWLKFSLGNRLSAFSLSMVTQLQSSSLTAIAHQSHLKFSDLMI